MKNKTPENAESRANQYALRCFCITMVSFFVVWVLNQLEIFIVEKSIVTVGLIVALCLFAVCLVLCWLLGLSNKYTKFMLMFFIVAITTVIGTMLTYHAVLLTLLPIIYSAMYHRSKAISIFTYVLTLLCTAVIVFAGYRIGVCDANMVLLTSNRLAAYTSDNGRFLLNQINDNPTLTLSLYYIFPRWLICSVFVPVCLNISKIIRKTEQDEENLRVLAEIDSMTGLYNKSKYLEVISDTSGRDKKIAVIFWDVNGLKKINDTLGHEFGDELIKIVAERIRLLSSATEKAYRVGGDEFVMLMHGGSVETAAAKVKLWQDSIAGLTVKDCPVSASVGYAAGIGAELEDIIKTADDMMYENKREYHRLTDKK